MQALLKLLQDGRFHSGEALGASLGVSRSAIWKKLQGLRSEFGVEVFSVPGKGYRLAEPLALLDGEVIARCASGFDWDVHVLPSLDSTNAEVMRRINAGVPAPFCLLAERQTAGRGRRGRFWVSPFAENLYCSLVVRVDGGMRQVEALSLTIGLAVARTLIASGIDGVGVKWPNDVLVRGRKVSGILLELLGDPADICHVVIGVGLNVNMLPEYDQAIDQPWTSMRQELGHCVDRNPIAAELINQLHNYLSKHWKSGFSGLRKEWEGLHLWAGSEASLIAGAKTVSGTILGVNDGGAIRLLVEGREVVFSGGELSLRLRHDS
ncbi:bifunctional biotin-(acetylCoA carboxylase) holoenzyme synthetase and DNA-binding transcriptional repressor, bio-5'-AMP-binding [Pseudomonas sp. 8Z]|uniref:bifunctional biotin--[acetyl-CoA-carboxylase] ligase/biotin operon repressor BirA n=1 Tax=Pseudomonas sp. 8Z TaxID=2653166 RepID=UPI0012F3DB3A|nr:bifunctional biotin--[acetyl-CoA-carboxylase] ligase/biotin operon repressor BirA [Pseudomonas sp. 8Z]VXC83928.1 bifunctional biotin-(acetylCoA carboxylase) holoenzyme synthetase and DNA-binding transcriptional repressor, bio-5'-AMP-binding [Pseudomonas sp. 8Z]